MKNVLLINPWIYDFAAYDFWIKPVGLLHIAGILKKYGFNINIIDCLDRTYQYKNIKKYKKFIRRYNTGKYEKVRVEKPECYKSITRNYSRYGISVEEFLVRLDDSPEPDVIIITSLMAYWYPGILKVLDIIKEKYNSSCIIAGGIYPVLWYEHAVKNLKNVFVIKGPGEIKILKFLKEKFNLDYHIPEKIENLIKLHNSDYSLYKKLYSAAVLTSRGCIFKCSYCGSNFIFNGFIQKPVDISVTQINSLIKRKIEDIAFYDDALLFNSEQHIIPILKKIKFNNNVRFHLPNAVHAKFVTKEISSLLYKTNFKTLRIGLETSDFSWHKSKGNKINKKEFESCVENLLNTGFTGNEIGVYVLIGLPGQIISKIYSTIDYIHSFNVKVFIASYSPIPGTPEFAIIKNESIKEEPLLTNNTIYPLYLDENKKKDLENIRIYAKNMNNKLFPAVEY